MTANGEITTGCPYDLNLGYADGMGVTETHDGIRAICVTFHDHGKHEVQEFPGVFAFFESFDDNPPLLESKFIERIGLQEPLKEVPVKETQGALRRGESFYTRSKQGHVRMYLQAKIDKETFSEDDKDCDGNEGKAFSDVFTIHLPVVYRKGIMGGTFHTSDKFVRVEYDHFEKRGE